MSFNVIKLNRLETRRLLLNVISELNLRFSNNSINFRREISFLGKSQARLTIIEGVEYWSARVSCYRSTVECGLLPTVDVQLSLDGMSNYEFSTHWLRFTAKDRVHEGISEPLDPVTGVISERSQSIVMPPEGLPSLNSHA